MSRIWKAAFAATALILVGGSTAPRRPQGAVTLPTFDGNLSVLTYNIKGLPWPVANGRPADLASIADRLRRLREQGRAPHVVVMQEAFTDEARAIGRQAGYRYVVQGPSATLAPPLAAARMGRLFAAGAHWWAGETEGKMIGSGLQLMSDFPVLDVRRMAFPVATCAGYDCLANKGVLFVRIAVPGADTPVDIVTTHLNCRTASGVADSRSDAAYAAQADLMTRFVAATRDPRNPLIVAGDLNVGKAPTRRNALFGKMAVRWAIAGQVHDALGQATRSGLPMSRDAIASLRHAKDWQIFAPGSAARLDLTGIAVPFGHGSDGTMLSDHIGYIAYFRVNPIRTHVRATA